MNQENTETPEESHRDEEMENARTKLLEVVFDLKPDDLELKDLFDSMTDEARVQRVGRDRVEN